MLSDDVIFNMARKAGFQTGQIDMTGGVPRRFIRAQHSDSSCTHEVRMLVAAAVELGRSLGPVAKGDTHADQ